VGGAERPVSTVACVSAAAIRANEVSENMPLSVRERTEGFLLLVKVLLSPSYRTEVFRCGTGTRLFTLEIPASKHGPPVSTDQKTPPND
jgi:hypothetical protein